LREDDCQNLLKSVILFCKQHHIDIPHLILLVLHVMIILDIKKIMLLRNIISRWIYFLL